MRYWAMARTLGMTDQEFWTSTMAKVVALFRFKVLELDYTRDYFPAFQVSAALNAKRTKETDEVFTAEDILAFRYPRKNGSVTITPEHDPDRGALGGQDLRSGLKDLTRKAIKKRKRLMNVASR